MTSKKAHFTRKRALPLVTMELNFECALFRVMATGEGTVEEKRRMPLSRLDTHRDEMINWESAEKEQVAKDTLHKMGNAISTLIECLGDSVEREGMRRTPIRAAKALCFFTKGYEDNLTSMTCTCVKVNGHRVTSDHVVYLANGMLVYIVFCNAC